MNEQQTFNTPAVDEAELWDAIKAELQREAARSNARRDKQRRRGKRSRSTINLERIGKKYGVPYHGYSRLDREAGNAILGTLRI